MADLTHAENMRIVLDYLRDENDRSLLYGNQGFVPSKFMSWLRTIDPVTLNEAVKTYQYPEPVHSHRTAYGTLRGNGIDLLVAAARAELDDTTTALGLFVGSIVTPMPKGPRVAITGGGGDHCHLYEESMEYLSGLYDTFRYHPDSMSVNDYAPLMHGNIYSATEDQRNGLRSLLVVTDKILHSDLDALFCVREGEHARQEPYRYHSGYLPGASIWLHNGELVKYVLENRRDCAFIADIIVERCTDDPEVISEIMKQGATAMASGVL